MSFPTTSLLLLALFAGIAQAQTAPLNPACPQATGPNPHCATANFTASPSNVTGYNLYVSTTATGCTPLSATTCTKLATVAAPATTITFNTTPTSFQFVDGKPYQLFLTAANGPAESPAVGVPATAPFLVPLPPSNVTGGIN